MKLLLVVLLAAAASAQFVGHPESVGKSVDAPQPGLVEMPFHQEMPFAPAAEFAGASQSHIGVPSPAIQVPNRLPALVDVPHSPIQMPVGGVQTEDMPYDIPQPVIGVPPPVIQRKPVIYNVPQPIVQIPQPIIRHKPILYTVPHVLRLQRPVIRHNLEHYNVAPALVQKSGYGGHVGVGLPGATLGGGFAGGFGV